MYVVVCPHVVAGAPILYVVRDEPTDEVDSGWQLLCGTRDEDSIEGAQIWAVQDALSKDNTLAEIIQYPIGTHLLRAAIGDEWEPPNAS